MWGGWIVSVYQRSSIVDASMVLGLLAIRDPSSVVKKAVVKLGLGV